MPLKERRLQKTGRLGSQIIFKFRVIGHHPRTKKLLKDLTTQASLGPKTQAIGIGLAKLRQLFSANPRLGKGAPAKTN